jgi:HSP20 family molecular chaperone IbpA
MTKLTYSPYERLFKDIMSEFEYPNLMSDTYFTYSTKESYTIEMPLVGVTKEELNIKVEGDFLKVEAKPTKTSKFVKNTDVHFSLREDADTAKISAKLENGLLTLTIPKTTPEKKSVNIKVN